MVVLPILSSNVTTLTPQLAIIPVVLIPLTGISVLLSSLATIIAGWFGIKLKMEGPKQLLEVLLTKKVLLSALVLNLLTFGAFRFFLYVKTLPKPIAVIEYYSSINAKPSQEIYEDSLGRVHSFNKEETTESAKTTIHELKERWTQKLEKGPFRSGVISGNSIFYGSDDGNVHEIDLVTGKLKRVFYVGTKITTRPVIYHSRLFFGEGDHDTHHARIYSFDLKSGKFLGAFKTKGHTEGQPLIATENNETLLFLTAGKDGLYAISPDTLKEKWHAIDGHLDASVSIENGVVYAGSGREKGDDKGRSYAIAYEFSSGKKIWRKELPLSNWMHPVIASENICYSLGEIYFASDVGLLHCLNKKSGEASFSIPFEAPLVGKPIIVFSQDKETVVVSSFNGDVCAINLKTRSKEWCVKTGTEKTTYAFGSVDYDPKRNDLWYASVDNGLFAIDLNSGAVKTHWQPNQSRFNKWNETDASVTILKDSLYLADIEGVIRKIDIQ